VFRMGFKGDHEPYSRYAHRAFDPKSGEAMDCPLRTHSLRASSLGPASRVQTFASPSFAPNSSSPRSNSTRGARSVWSPVGARGVEPGRTDRHILVWWRIPVGVSWPVGNHFDDNR
jgi:hypothetical protein